MTTYIAGPMSLVGPPTWNYPAFEETAKRLRDKGIEVISPHELHEPDRSIPWDWYLRQDLAALVTCDSIVLLPLWGHSPGATLEHHVAKALGMTAIYPEEFEDWYKGLVAR